MLRIISGKWKHRRLQTLPDDQITRPTANRVRESIFNILQGSIPGTRVLDLFSGSGALGLEALSRGALEAVFVEKSPAAVAVIRKNFAELGVPGSCARIIEADVTEVLRNPARWQLNGLSAEHVFADPPYASDWYSQALTDVGQSEICSKNCTLCIEMDGYTRLIPDTKHHWKQQSRRKYGKTFVEFWTRTES